MAVKAIAHSYWRRIKAGARTFDQTPVELKDDVRALAREDVASGIISEADYERLIGEPYKTTKKK